MQRAVSSPVLRIVSGVDAAWIIVDEKIHIAAIPANSKHIRLCHAEIMCRAEQLGQRSSLNISFVFCCNVFASVLNVTIINHQI
jgi:hypothetical protein